MQIILQEDIDKLGHRGDVVTVKPGYARNYLLPRKLAVQATTGNLKAIERIRASLAKKTATELEAAQKQAELLNVVALKFTRKTGENDQMFGSVTTADIAEGLAAQGFKIDKRQVQLAEPIKIIGESRSEEHTSELQSQFHLVCRLLLEKKKKKQTKNINEMDRLISSPVSGWVRAALEPAPTQDAVQVSHERVDDPAARTPRCACRARTD